MLLIVLTERLPWPSWDARFACAKQRSNARWIPACLMPNESMTPKWWSGLRLTLVPKAGAARSSLRKIAPPGTCGARDPYMAPEWVVRIYPVIAFTATAVLARISGPLLRGRAAAPAAAATTTTAAAGGGASPERGFQITDYVARPLPGLAATVLQEFAPDLHRVVRAGKRAEQQNAADELDGELFELRVARASERSARLQYDIDRPGKTETPREQDVDRRRRARRDDHRPPLIDLYRRAETIRGDSGLLKFFALRADGCGGRRVHRFARRGPVRRNRASEQMGPRAVRARTGRRARRSLAP